MEWFENSGSGKLQSRNPTSGAKRAPSNGTSRCIGARPYTEPGPHPSDPGQTLTSSCFQYFLRKERCILFYTLDSMVEQFWNDQLNHH